MYKALLTISLLLAIGCTPPAHTVDRPRLPKDAAEREYEQLWQASRKTLMKYGFELEWQDRRSGMMTTRAISSGYLLEAAWRHDATSLYYLGENTLHNMYRAAEVSIERTPTGSYTFTVQVAMARSNAKPRMITDSSTLTTEIRGEITKIKPSRSAYKDPAYALRNRYVFEDLIRPTQLTAEQKYRMSVGQERPKIFTPLGYDRTMADLIAKEISSRCGVKPVLSSELEAK